MAVLGHSPGNSGDETSNGPLHAAKPAAPPGRRALRYAGVYLLDEGSEGSPGPELTLDLDDEGIRLSRPEGDTRWASPWADVSTLRTTGEGRLPDGRRGLIVAATTADGESRLLAVGSRRPGAAGARIRAVARRHRVDPDRPDRRVFLPVAIGVVAVSGALVAWLLLAAGHVVAR